MEVLHLHIGRSNQTHQHVKFFCPCGAEVIKRKTSDLIPLCTKCSLQAHADRQKEATLQKYQYLYAEVEECGGSETFLYYKKSGTKNRLHISFKCQCGGLVLSRMVQRAEKGRHYCHDCINGMKLKKIDRPEWDGTPINKLSLYVVRKFFRDHGSFPTFTTYSDHKQTLSFVCSCGNRGTYNYNTKYLGVLPKCDACRKLNYTRDKAPNWGPGLTQEQRAEGRKRRRPEQFYQWSRAVMAKANYTCVLSGQKGDVCAHHLFNWADYPHLRYEPSNGICISRSLHKKFHQLYGKRNNTVGQFNDFMQNHAASFCGPLNPPR